MMKLTLRLPTIVLSAMICIAAQASPVRWHVKDVRFTDSGQASGFFVYDNSTGTVLDWNITVSGGDEFTFPRGTYLRGNSFVLTAPPPSTAGTFIFRSSVPQACPPCPIDPSFRDFRITTASPLSGSVGAVVALDFTGDTRECYNCSPFRDITAGSLEAIPGRTIPMLSRAGYIGLAAMLAILGLVAMRNA